MYIFKTLFFLILIGILNSCKNDDSCNMPREGEKFILSDSIKSYVSNYEDTKKIIFKTEIGDEVGFNVSELQDFDSEYLIRGICETDISQGQTVKGTSQIVQLSLVNLGEIIEPIFIALSEIPVPPNNIDVKESIFVTCGEWLSNSFDDSDGLLWVILNDYNDKIIFHDSLEILGKTFYSVFEPKNISPTPKLKIKYTINEGVVFIGNTANGKEYVYERKE